ncbi:hypothetical protein L6164_013484 [Bauhinia variegata]|uniref:Uncharacterized protein n=1 Tax=Bauhinia variegata TaxID=167791 RepID=A0ACB9NGC2_BAUVA|nr:hypothetical protein L6164_013484 [Bauhinia variegata]
MKCLLGVGLWCTHPNDKERPKASEVIKVIQHEISLPELSNNMRDSAFFSNGFQSNLTQSQAITTSFDIGGC